MKVCRVQWNRSGRTSFRFAKRRSRSHDREKFCSAQKNPSGFGNAHSLSNVPLRVAPQYHRIIPFLMASRAECLGHRIDRV
jgi:hypothetical protein